MTPKSKKEASRTAGEKARGYLKKYGSWAQSTILALQETFEMKDENVFKAAGVMSGGIGGMHDACGSLLGASLFFGQVAGRRIKDFNKKRAAKPSMELTGQLYKWYEKEFGSPTCYDIRKKFGGGAFYEMSVPWQKQLAEEAGLHEQCVELAGKTAAKAAEMIWERIGNRE